MVVDCGLELKKYNVVFVSLWLGLVKIEYMLNVIENIVEDKKFEIVVGFDLLVCYFFKNLKKKLLLFYYFLF